MANKIEIKRHQNSLLKPLGVFMRRFHLIIFFIFIVAIVAAVVLLINKTLTESSDATYTSTINAGSIDQATLDRVQALHSSNEPEAAPALPQGRVNPFAE